MGCREDMREGKAEAGREASQVYEHIRDRGSTCMTEGSLQSILLNAG